MRGHRNLCERVAPINTRFRLTDLGGNIFYVLWYNVLEDWNMKFSVIMASIAAAYVLIILILELLIWRTQPAMDSGVTLTIKDGNETITRVLYGHEAGGSLYVSSNHWFRSWYWAALRNPEIQVVYAGEVTTRIAKAVTPDSKDGELASYEMGFILRLICGFAPRKFLKLELPG